MTTLIENCLICQESFGKDEKVFTCIKCVKKCHMDCLLYLDEEIKQYNINKCDVCRTLENFNKESEKVVEKILKEIKCAFCQKNEGFLMKFKDKKDKWTHIKCIKWFMKSVKLISENGFIHFKAEKPMESYIWMGECLECKKTVKGDFFIQCNTKNCQNTFHTNCIQAHLLEEIKTDERVGFLNFHCEEHVKIKKTNDVFSDLRTYGKNINSDSQLKIGIVKEYDNLKTNSQDVIIQTFKPYIVQEDDKPVNNLKIKMRLTEDSSNSFNDFSNNDDKNRGLKNIFNKKDELNSNKFLKKYKLYNNDHKNKNEESENEEAAYSEDYGEMFVNTNIRCDICSKLLDYSKEEQMKKCENCLTYYHKKCSSDYGNSYETCIKCNSQNTSKCIACERLYGSMIQCSENWVHIFCMLLLKKYFYIKPDKKYNVALEPKQNKIVRSCDVCKISNVYTIKCPNCEINFHPYCGLMSNFDFILIERKNVTDPRSKFEINFTCENHQFFRNCKNKIKKSQKNWIETIMCDTSNIRKRQVISNSKIMNKDFSNRKLRFRLNNYVELESLNFKFLKKLFTNKSSFHNDPVYFHKTQEWNWDLINQFFTPFTMEDLNACEFNKSKITKKIQSTEDLLEDLITNNEIDKNFINISTLNYKTNKIVCKINSRNRKNISSYLSIYDISKVKDMKLYPEYLSYYSELNNLKENKEIQFHRKRHRPQENEYNGQSDLIISKSLKLIEVDSQSENISPNTKFKMKIEDDKIESNSNFNFIPYQLGSLNTNSNDNEGELDLNSDKNIVTITSTNDSNLKFLKKIKLLSFVKLSKRDKRLLQIEDGAIKKVKELLRTRNLSINNLYDIDQELLISHELLISVVNKNKLILSNLHHKIVNKHSHVFNSHKIDYDLTKKLLTAFKSLTVYSHIKRRLFKGVEDKSIDDLVKNRGQNKKLGKTVMRDKEEYDEYMKDAYETLKITDSECCVCFYSDFDDSNPIVFCDSCNVSIHQECYGIKEIPEGNYFCELCIATNKVIASRSIISNQTNNSESSGNIGNLVNNHNDKKNILMYFQSKECVLCGKNQGAMKKIDRNSENWAHVTCIILSPSMNFKDFLKMDEIIVSDSPPKNSQVNCWICSKNSGDLFQSVTCQRCEFSSFKYFHFFCAYLEGFKIKLLETGTSNIEELHYKKLAPLILCDCDENKSFPKRDRSKQIKLRNITYHKKMNSVSPSKFKIRTTREKILPTDISINISEDPLEQYRHLISDNLEMSVEVDQDVNHNHQSVIKFYKSCYEDLNLNHDLLKSNYFDKVNKCSVCFGDISDEMHNETLITRCNICNISFHNNCYNFESFSLSKCNLLCDYCKSYKRLKKQYSYPQCLLCTNKGGAVKKCNTNLLEKIKTKSYWIHVICANYVDEIYLNKNCYEGFDSIAPKKLNYFNCEVCNSKRGHVIKCSIRSCIVKFHVYCAYLSQFHKFKNQKGSKYVFYCKSHTILYNECHSGSIIIHLKNSVLKELKNKNYSTEVTNFFKNYSNDIGYSYTENNEKIIADLTLKYEGDELFYNIIQAQRETISQIMELIINFKQNICIENIS